MASQFYLEVQQQNGYFSVDILSYTDKQINA